MNIQQDIERQEKEFEELLQTVMKVPLSPITHLVEEINKQLYDLEQLLQDMRDSELSTLTLSAGDMCKQIKSLKSITEEIPHEVGNSFKPLIEKLEQGTLQSIRDLKTELAAQLGRTAEHTAQQMAGLAASIGDSQSTIQLSLRQGVEQLEQCHQSALKQVTTELVKVAGDLTGKLTQQSENEQQSSSRLQEIVAVHATELKHQSATGLEQIQTTISEQAHQMVLFKQQQVAWSEQLTDQVMHSIQPIRKWLITSVFLAGSCLSGVVILVIKTF